MKINQRLLIIALTFTALFVFCPPPAVAGGHFGVHIGAGGFGVSLGAGDWGVYTDAWSNPQWSPSFNTALAGYGEWVWIDGLGRCWRPWVAAGWRPYTYGRWVQTGLSLTWVSYEPWGYFPHHYGSWAHATYGWVWVPGYTYVSANVTWVRGGGYVGWYARPPYGWSHAAGAFHHSYGQGYRDGWNDARYGTYVGWQDFGADNISHHAVAHTVSSRTRLTHGGAAPAGDELWQKGRTRVATSRLSTRTVRMEGREVVLARPEGVGTSIERHASPTVRDALAESAQRSRQPQAGSRQPSPGRSTAPAAAESSSDRGNTADPRERSSGSVGRHSPSKVTLSRPDLRSPSSHRTFRGTTISENRSDAGRAGDRPFSTESSRKTAAPKVRDPAHTLRKVTPVSIKKSPQSRESSAAGSTAQIRERRVLSRPKTIEREQPTAGSSKANSDRRAEVRKR